MCEDQYANIIESLKESFIQISNVLRGGGDELSDRIGYINKSGDYTNNMDNNTYFPSGMAEEDGKVTIVANSYNTNVATNLLNFRCKSGGSTIDREVICVTIHGDLA